MQLGFAKVHHKITPIGKSGRGLGLGKHSYIVGSPLIFLQRACCPLSISGASCYHNSITSQLGNRDINWQLDTGYKTSNWFPKETIGYGKISNFTIRICCLTILIFWHTSYTLADRKINNHIRNTSITGHEPVLTKRLQVLKISSFDILNFMNSHNIINITKYILMSAIKCCLFTSSCEIITKYVMLCNQMT